MGDLSSATTQMTRRSFLKMTGVAAGALGLAGASSMLTTDGWLSPASAHATVDEHIARTYHQSHCGGMCSLACTVRDLSLIHI